MFPFTLKCQKRQVYRVEKALTVVACGWEWGCGSGDWPQIDRVKANLGCDEKSSKTSLHCYTTLQSD